MSLYRKYRPRTFGELVGQQPVVTAIQNALATRQTVHAYLFAGPRGSGKTSLARLLARALNCQEVARDQPLSPSQPPRVDPCNRCETCKAGDEGRLMDLIEIDAASNRGIDNMRDIRQQVAYAPTLARHKVYIIDEVHMLSKDAANAFLKTLEEPPPYVVFILATTEVMKLLPTVVSRCQRYDFRKIEFSASLGRLAEVVKAEQIAVTDEALSFIVGRGDGSLRDMLGLLEQVVSFQAGSTTIDKAACLSALGMVGDDALFDLVEATVGPDPGRLLSLTDQLSSRGIDASVVVLQLCEHLRKLLWISTGNDGLITAGTDSQWMDRARAQARTLGVAGILALLERVSDAGVQLKSASIPYFVLELALLKGGGGEILDLRARLERLERCLDTSRPSSAPAGPGGIVRDGGPFAPLVPPPNPPSVSPSGPEEQTSLTGAIVVDPQPPATLPDLPSPAAAPAGPAHAADEPPAPPQAAPPAVPSGKAAKAPPRQRRAPLPQETRTDQTVPVEPPVVAAVPVPPASSPGPAPAVEPPVTVEASPVDLVDGDDEDEDDTDLDHPDAVRPRAAPVFVSGDPQALLSTAWERIMNRIKGANLRTHALLKDVVRKEVAGGGKKCPQLRLVLPKGHDFAVKRLRQESNVAVVADAIDKELSIKMTITIDEDSKAISQETSVTAAPRPEREWADKKAVSSNGVQTLISTLDAEVIRVE